jgi:hypothetical protein
MDMNEDQASIYWPTTDDVRGILEAHQAAVVVIVASGCDRRVRLESLRSPNLYRRLPHFTFQ